MGTKYRGAEDEKLALDTYTKLMRATESVNGRITGRKPLPPGLTVSQFGVLEALYHLGPMNQLTIGGKILKSPGNITHVVDNLVRDDLVLREKDQNDRRQSVVFLTDKGKKVIAEVFPRMMRAITRELSVLSGQEQKTLSRLLKKLGKK